MLDSLTSLNPQRSCRTPKSRRKDKSAGQQSSAHVGPASDNHNQALQVVKMNGYDFDPKKDRHPGSTSVVKARKDGKVLALKVLGKRTIETKGEVQIHCFLQSQQSERRHVIELVDVISCDFGDILVMPWLSPLEVVLDEHPELRPPLGIQFLEAVRFLHRHNVAHLDLKPANTLVDLTGVSPPSSPSSPYLSLIDFGLSMSVRDENTEVVGYRGTPSWSAPEVGTEYGSKARYKAILADRWSCGKVLGYIAGSQAGGGVSIPQQWFDLASTRLRHRDPSKRPSLDEVLWSQGDHAILKGKTKRTNEVEVLLAHSAPKRACVERQVTLAEGPNDTRLVYNNTEWYLNWYVRFSGVVCRISTSGFTHMQDGPSNTRQHCSRMTLV